MTTLAVDKPRAYGLGVMNDVPVIASDIIYEGAAVGLVAGTGHARPLVAGDIFAGFALTKADNSLGSAADINVHVQAKGLLQLDVTGAVITDVGQPVYAQDDNAFSFSPVSGTFIGFVKRFVSSGIVIVEFDAYGFKDPWGAFAVREALAASTLTLDIEDSGKLIWCTVTTVITLPAVATPTNTTIANGGPFGTVQISLSPAAADKVRGPNMAGTDNKDHINTLATARRGDFVRLVIGDADGPFVSEQRGIWATEG